MFIKAFKEICPGFYLKTRNHYHNTKWLAKWVIANYSPVACEYGNDAYDRKFWEVNAGGDWLGFAGEIINFFNPKSIIDIGCGTGRLLAALREVSPEVKVRGIDGSPTAVAICREKGLEVIQANLTGLNEQTIASLCKTTGKFDLAVCLEVAEHLPFWHANRLIELITNFAPCVIFSAAHPNQGGTFHLNEQPQEYWVSKFKKHRYIPADRCSLLRDRVNRLDLQSYYKANLLLFEMLQNRLPAKSIA